MIVNVFDYIAQYVSCDETSTHAMLAKCRSRLHWVKDTAIQLTVDGNDGLRREKPWAGGTFKNGGMRSFM